jgi:Ca2+-dependent lipid-binding protein
VELTLLPLFEFIEKPLSKSNLAEILFTPIISQLTGNTINLAGGGVHPKRFVG